MMEEILSVKNLKKNVVKGVSFSIRKKETLVLAGLSGAGKTTTANLILRSIEPDGGSIIFDGIEITDKAEVLRKLRTECGLIHQDPYASIDPRMTVLEIIKEPLEALKIGSPQEQENLVFEALREVKLEPAEEIARKYPHMLSGGQRQRVAIARTIVTKPKLVIADEPVSMLDLSVRAGILDLFRELQEKLGISFLFITHDLCGARYIGHTIAILYNGEIVETGPINEVLNNPRHPHTQSLINSILQLYR